MHLRTDIAPFLPVVSPTRPPPGSSFGQILPEGSKLPLPSSGDGELPWITAPTDPNVSAQQRLLKWGAVGVAAGAVANGLVMAMAFRSFRASKSAWKPALWAAGGSVVIGGTLLWILSRSLTQPLDQRVVAATVGIKLAT